MKHSYNKALDEHVYETVLANGLKVCLVPKSDYHRTYGVLTTHFGSNDQLVRHKETGELRAIPAGAAHFLEHKMFEGLDGQDAFALFMKQGAMANAFTHYFQTSYLFSASYHIERNVETLLDFVQTPHFTAEGIEKEKGIILQELHMYQDNPASVAYQALQASLYPDHPLGLDILGTESSIKATSYEDLRLAYDTFYHPSNMNLMVVGNIDPQALLAVIEANQAQKQPAPPLYERVQVSVEAAVIPDYQLSRAVSQPILELAWRLPALDLKGPDLVKQRLIGEIFMELVMGPMSQAYASWYQQGWVDTNFYQDYQLEGPMHHLLVHAQTHQVDELSQAVEQTLANWRDNPDLTEAQLQAVVRGRVGDLLQHFNSVEFIAYELIDAILDGYQLEDSLMLLQSLRLADIEAFAQTYLDQTERVEVRLLPCGESSLSQSSAY